MPFNIIIIKATEKIRLGKEQEQGKNKKKEVTTNYKHKNTSTKNNCQNDPNRASEMTRIKSTESM